MCVCVCVTVCGFVLDIRTTAVGSSGSDGHTERQVTEGDAVVFEAPLIDSYPPASVQWVDATNSRLPRTADAHHITLGSDLVLLNARYTVHNNAVFRATATNGYARQTVSGPLYILRVRRKYSTVQYGGVAQWLGRRTLAGGLFLTYAWSIYDHFVGKLSAMGQPTRPTQPSVPLGLVNEYELRW